MHLYLDDDDPQREGKLARFLQNEDRHGRGVYQCIGWLRHRARVRNAENVVALPFIVSDLDLKNIASRVTWRLIVLRSAFASDRDTRLREWPACGLEIERAGH